MPYSTLSTTSTICEIKYGEQPKLVAHYKNDGSRPGPPIPPKSVILTNPDVSNKSYRDQISSYVNLKKDRDEGSAYKRVEIFWPNKLLKVSLTEVTGVNKLHIPNNFVGSLHKQQNEGSATGHSIKLY